MRQEELLLKLHDIVNLKSIHFRVKGNQIFIDAARFSFTQMQKIEKILHQYGSCAWWVERNDENEKIKMTITIDTFATTF